MTPRKQELILRCIAVHRRGLGHIFAGIFVRRRVLTGEGRFLIGTRLQSRGLLLGLCAFALKTFKLVVGFAWQFALSSYVERTGTVTVT